MKAEGEARAEVLDDAVVRLSACPKSKENLEAVSILKYQAQQIRNRANPKAKMNKEPPTADVWHKAVLQACMAIEAAYVEADPGATLKNLIDWHVENERNPVSQPSVSDADISECPIYY